MRDFFERQDEARRNTLLLALYFLAAVGLLIALVSMAIYVLFTFDPSRLYTTWVPFNLNWRSWNFAVIAQLALAIFFLITCGALYKYIRLRSGGGGLIAEMMGGRLIYPDTSDFHEKRLLNIIEEMAIASGVTVPCVYLLADERGINAFAAGFSQEDAVLGVTRGALHYLSREELQGVIAHEFSHILGGDMLINIRLHGLLHGILVLGLLGESLMRGGARTGRVRGSITIGLILYIVGYGGVFVGRFLKSAISRQREFLADASAVQFTRNPLGLAGALKKIGGLAGGSRIRNPRAAEISHMYFGNGVARSWFNAFSTHPPLLQRIKRLDPEFQGPYPEDIKTVPVDQEEALMYAAAAFSQAAGTPAVAVRGSRAADDLAPGGDLRKAITRPGPAHMRLARERIDSLPEAVRNAARNGFGARAVIYGLLLDRKQQVWQQQLASLAKDADPRVWQEFRRLLPEITELGPELRFPLAELAIPALKTLTAPQYAVFRKNIDAMIKSDGRIDLFEYALQFFVLEQLAAFFGKTRQQLVPISSRAKLQDEISCVLTLLARYGHDDEKDARKAMMRAIRNFKESWRKYIDFQPEGRCSLSRFDQSLRQLNSAAIPIKRRLLEAAVTCIAWDKRITVREAELFRVISVALASPVPPWLSVENMDSAS